MYLFETSIFISVIHIYENIIARQQIDDITNISYHFFLNMETVFIFYEFLIIINNQKKWKFL